MTNTTLSALLLCLLAMTPSILHAQENAPEDQSELTPVAEAAASAESDDSTQAEVTFKPQVTEAIIARTNQFRKENGLPAVAVDEQLTETARQFARFMAVNDKYGHQADGRTPAQRAKAAGYDYCAVRENIAYRTNPVDPSKESLVEVFAEGWIDSPPHRENMLADYVTETGVAVATDDGSTFYAVQLFGRPRSAAIEIRLTQRSDEAVTLTVESRGNKDEMVLEPRMRLRMTRCFPTTLSLNESEEGIELTEDAELVIEEGEIRRVDSE